MRSGARMYDVGRGVCVPVLWLVEFGGKEAAVRGGRRRSTRRKTEALSCCATRFGKPTIRWMEVYFYTYTTGAVCIMYGCTTGE